MLPFLKSGRSPVRTLAPALLVSGLALTPAQATVVSAEGSAGYGAQVMDIILSHWAKPPQATGSTSVMVRITNEGRPYSCELRKPSGNPQVDDAICLAVAKAAVFPPPPYGVPADVALTFLYEGATGHGGAAAPAAVPLGQAPSYADSIMENARARLQVPNSARGHLSSTVRLTILPDGTLAEYKMEKSSGAHDFDAAVLQALLQPGVIPPPPDNQRQDVYLTFSLNRQ